ncbi:MAG: methyltransferase domain-containing protein [Patescibacteria group bacterium]
MPHNKYIFILGKNPELSLLEITSLLPQKNVYFQSDQCLIIESEEKNITNIQKKLGGTVKIGELISETSNIDTKIFLENLSPLAEEKIYFGFSRYGFDKFSKQFFKLGLEIKKALKQEGKKVRFVESKEPDLSSVIVQKEILNKGGVDFLIIKNQDNYIIGKTLTVQDFKLYSKLDYGRPAADPKSGMLPPKIAKIMINISGTNKDENILDPFCGSGTILQEAAILGYQNLYGSDISNKAINDTKKNIEWLKNNFSLSDINFQIEKIDATKSSQHYKKKFFDAIITEVNLGPSNVNAKNIQSIQNEMQDFYNEALDELKRIIKPDAKLIIAFPAWNINDQIHRLHIKQKSFHAPILYGREGAKVLREIHFLG